MDSMGIQASHHLIVTYWCLLSHVSVELDKLMLTSGVFLSTCKFCSSIRSNFFPLLIFFYTTVVYASWASGALDPERDASGDLVTSVKRFVNFNLITSHFAVLIILLSNTYAKCPHNCFSVGVYGQ